MNCMFCESEINENDIIQEGLDARMAGQKTCPLEYNCPQCIMFGLLKPVWEDSRLTLSLRIRKGEWRLADASESFVNKAMITIYKNH